MADYWCSDLARDRATIQGIGRRQQPGWYQGALQGSYKNADVTRDLCFFDYLRGSRDPNEHHTGQALWEVAERIVASSLLEGGRLLEVKRATFTPMVEQAGYQVPLQNLSSGNAYLIGRMMLLLGRMYDIATLRGDDPATARMLPGILLIDEAENHLHPKWQKRFLPAILEVFPNLQIIATTHSPFVLASAPGARVFVCRYDTVQRTCVIDESERFYENMAIDQILASPAFDETTPFGTRISTLLDQRAAAITLGDEVRRRAIENELRALNPSYFGYLDLDTPTRGHG